MKESLGLLARRSAHPAPDMPGAAQIYGKPGLSSCTLLLQAYAFSFFLVPAWRWFQNKVQNGAIEARNKARLEAAALVKVNKNARGVEGCWLELLWTLRVATTLQWPV